MPVHHLHRHMHHLEGVTGEVQKLLSRLAASLTVGDGYAVAQLWDVPGLVISATEVVAISSVDQLAKMFGGARAHYNAHGIVETRAEVQHEDWIGDNLVVVKVRWPYLAAGGGEVGAERSSYTMRRNDRGQLRVVAVLMRGVEKS